jgi:malonate-semialdehyde dehydrogenase (acetylating) / methylmalonate-semialdehyde dehydrogenase
MSSTNGSSGVEPLCNYIDGQWVAPNGPELVGIPNPATGEVLARVPLCGNEEIASAAVAAERAFSIWRWVPLSDRIQFLFKLKAVMERDFQELAATITKECGKTIGESRGELRRAIENVELACSMPILMQGYNAEDIARGIDESMIRQPLGVAAIIAPFNFPAMIPFWFFPYAIACGNTCIIKPSERVPLTMSRIAALMEEIQLPGGVVNLVHGGRDAVNALIDHPSVRAVSFVGSTTVARSVYARAAAAGKRAQCQGGAKNAVIVLPDCDVDMTTRIVADSAFGCAGQRCLAASLAITVGTAKSRFEQAIGDAAQARVVGNGLDESVEMGPVISPESKSRIEGCIDAGMHHGANVLVDGRSAQIPGGEHGNFLRPTVLAGVHPDSELAQTEVFGPVLSLIHVENLQEAISVVNGSRYGNMACLFTSSGASAREFRSKAEVGNIGINVGVAAPVASFPFTGWKDSFFGDLHGQGRDAVQFFTQEKVVVERWPNTWSRKF